MSKEIYDRVSLPKRDKVFCNKSIQGENRSETKKHFLV